MARSPRPLRRWAVRLVLREWRQQLLILGLIAVATAVASFGTVAVFHASQPRSAFNGIATARLTIRDPATNTDVINRIEGGSIGPVDITAIRFVSREGSNLNFVLADPPLESELGAEVVRVVDGVRPSKSGEVALTQPLAGALGASIGDTVPVDNRDLVVVGLVEDPSNLGIDAAIVAPAQLDAPDEVSILTAAPRPEVQRLVDREQDIGWEGLGDVDNQRLLSVVAIYLLAMVAMIEIALLCAAAFTVLAQRRLHQFGLLAAVGATSRQVGQTLRFNALVLGFIGGTFGACVGFAASMAARPWFERTVGWRMDGWSMPLLSVTPFVALAALTAVAGAWWPSLRLAHLPPADALSSRRPTARPARRKGFAGVVTFIAGAALLSYGTANADTIAAVLGLLVAITGVLLVTPVVVASAGLLAPHLPLGPRIALRDIARHQTRSAACLAALVVAFGIPTAIIVTSASADANLETGPPNLPDNWALIAVDGGARGDLPPGFSPEEYQATIDAVSRRLPNADITPIMFLTELDTPNAGADFLPTVRVSQSAGADGTGLMFRDFAAWIATEDLLTAVGGDPMLADSSAPVLGDPAQQVFVGRIEIDAGSENGLGQASGEVTPQALNVANYGAVSDYWIPESQIDTTSQQPITGAWLLTQPSPFTNVEKSALFDTVADSLTVEIQRPSQVSTELRTNAALAGGFVTLAILALTVSLLRAESSGDQRVLTALGARRGTRRRVAAATTGFLALGGATLALPAGYLALAAIMSDRSAGFPFVFPTATLAGLLIGTPTIATIITYILTGRQQAGSLARTSG